MNHHLHDRVTALVDGELSPGARSRALGHLRHCEPCRAAVDAERATRQVMAQAPAVEPSSDLVARLLAMGGPQGPMRPREGHVPGTPRVPALAAPGREPRPARARSSRPAGRPAPEPRVGTAPGPPSPARTAARRTRRRLTAAVLGTVSLATIGMLGVGVMGGAVRVPSAAEPVLGRLVVERAGVAGDTSVVAPVARLTGPDAVPQPSGTP